MIQWEGSIIHLDNSDTAQKKAKFYTRFYCLNWKGNLGKEIQFQDQVTNIERVEDGGEMHITRALHQIYCIFGYSTTTS